MNKIFLSYRRDGGEIMAAMLYKEVRLLRPPFADVILSGIYLFQTVWK